MNKKIGIIVCIALVLHNCVVAQTMITKTIKSFGAKGDGRTNDTEAFNKAANFFNKRGGYGKLIITKGTYIVGRQVYNNKDKSKKFYDGKDVLLFKNVLNVTIEGQKGATIKYADSLLFGSFEPASGRAYKEQTRDVYDNNYAAEIGSCIYIENCNGIKITGLTLNGNNSKIKYGGIWGDVGIQLRHIGVFIITSKNVTVNNISANYFGLDGICVWNFSNDTSDNIKLINSTFDYNNRQGLSWIGGNHLYVNNCKFNHTGKGEHASMPRAGVDIEAAGTKVRNGVFENCEFTDNAGCGLTADQGDNADCRFINCIFWGVINYSAWVRMPGFAFNDCKFYGSFVHGYNSPNGKDATTFIKCWFEDKPYKGTEPYGGFLMDTNDAKRMLFDSCTFVANKQKISWIQLNGNYTKDEYYRMYNSKIIIKGLPYKKDEVYVVMRGIQFKNNTVLFENPKAKDIYQWPQVCCTVMEDLGGNKVIYGTKE